MSMNYSNIKILNLMFELRVGFTLKRTLWTFTILAHSFWLLKIISHILGTVKKTKKRAVYDFAVSSFISIFWPSYQTEKLT